MNNVERIACHIAKHGSEGILINTIPGTPNWIVCERISQDQWKLTLCNPQKTSSYNLGIINDNTHASLWKELLHAEINHKLSMLKIAKI